MKIAMTKEKIYKICEGAYLLILAAFICLAMLGTTKFDIVWPDYLYEDLKDILLLVIIAKLGFENEYRIYELLLIFIIAGCFLFNINRTGYTQLELIVLLIIGARNIEFEKIVKTYFIVSFAILTITIFSALTGQIENLVYIQEGRRARMAMGIGYPTDFAAYVFFDVLAYCYIRGRKIKYIEFIIIFALGIGIYLITDARVDMICIIMTACIFTYIKAREDYAKRQKKEYQVNKWWSFILSLAPLICAAFMIAFCILYSFGSPITNLLDKILNYRLSQGNKAIDIFGFTLWGQYIPMQGFGGTTEIPSHYFFLDSSYVNIIMQYGILIFGSILLLWVAITFKARKEKNWLLLWTIAIISVQCMIEHHMLDIAYNPFLLALLASTVKKEKQSIFSVLRNKIQGEIYDK